MSENYASKAIKIALEEVGYLEKKNGTLEYLYDKTANAGSANYTKYGYEMHQLYPSVMDYPAYYCDAFVDWCFYKAFGVANAKGLLGGNFNDYTVASAQLYKNKGAYYKKNPKIGDQIFFNNGTRICHTGIVYKVDSSKVYTIEGNTSGGSTVVANGGGVAKKSYSLSYKRIDGYGRPKYDAEPTNVVENTAPKFDQTSVNKVVQAWINIYLGSNITVSGVLDSDTKKYMNMCLEKALELATNGKLSTTELAKIKYSNVKSSVILTKILESYLFLRGFNPQDYNGNYNDKVVESVRQYQSAVGIGVDGQAGSGTFTKLVF